MNLKYAIILTVIPVLVWALQAHQIITGQPSFGLVEFTVAVVMALACGFKWGTAIARRRAA